MIALKADQLHDGGGRDESDSLVLVWSRDSRKAKASRCSRSRPGKPRGLTPEKIDAAGRLGVTSSSDGVLPGQGRKA
jgi:hypothetical protein